ncbi:MULTISPECIES: PIG-L family deacetylase [Burkholderia]|uniref:PIG-L family deacetylase n=1 Tax=Burkholderia TaxID=32008 RepID=UPI000F542F91|nr:PIG-L family deacetylase [Burkholderia gladioli]NBI44875.1 GlcNAc-PI de-N-acetylase [Burkholderia sp. ISTR5]
MRRAGQAVADARLERAERPERVVARMRARARGTGAEGGAARLPDTTRDAQAPLFVVSPHLDDAVFGCAALLAARPGAVVCTVFAGTPAAPQQRDWDRAAGFTDSTAAMDERRREDERALAWCAARGVYLDFLDAQYGASPTVSTLARALAAQLARYPGAVPLLPLGLRHPDHERVARAWLALLRAGRIGACLVYEEAIHRAVPEQTARRLHELEQAGLEVTPLDGDWCPAREARRARGMKRRAVAAYASQLRAFGAGPLADLDGPERYWRVERADAPARSCRA